MALQSRNFLESTSMALEKSVSSSWVRRGCLLIALVAFSLGATPRTGQAQEYSDPDAEARRIFTIIMSPYCPGLMLADCGSSAAAVLRDSIKTQLRRGRPSQEIVDELVATFGEEVLALPPNRGMGRLAWLGPIGALLTSLLIIFWWVRQRQAPAPEQGDAASSRPAESGKKTDLRQRLEEELKEFD